MHIWKYFFIFSVFI